MRKVIFPVLSLAVLAGCMSSAPKAPDCWTIEMDRAGLPDADVAGMGLPAVRVASPTVRAPYDGTRLAVLRADGSLAFDGFNAFAASPALILRGTVQDALESAGLTVVAPTSSAHADATIETTVLRLALDCRRDGRRDAVVSLSLTLVDGRRVQATGRGEGRESAMAGDYSSAFSRAFVKAVSEALAQLGTQKQ